MRKVLIVEDQIIVASDLEQRLLKTGFLVTDMVISGEESLTSIQKNPPDVVLMDIHLAGEMNGIQAAEEIRRRFDLPVIFITAYADSETLKEAKITRPFGYILKPIKDNELHTSIELALHNHWYEHLLRAREQWLATVLGCIGDGVVAIDVNGRVNFMNTAAEVLLDMTSLKVVGKLLTDVLNLLSNEDTGLESVVADVLGGALTEGHPHDYILVTSTDEHRYITLKANPLIDHSTQTIGAVFVLRDVSERHRHEEERDQLIGNLRQALDEVNTLQGLIPICASCKKIRDDDGYWHQIETYLSQHAGASFTHGLCPDCMKRLYPEYAEEILNAPEEPSEND